MLPVLNHIRLAPLDVETLRERAPGVVHSLVTYNRHTNALEPAGLFDEAIFGTGASLDLPVFREGEPVTRERATRFGRIVLTDSAPNALLDGVLISELAVLPPDLRPIVLRDRAYRISDLNELYRDVLVHNGRLAKLREINAPAPVLESTRAALSDAVGCLLDNERRPTPRTNAAGRVFASLWRSLRPDPEAALKKLDEVAAAGVDLTRPLPIDLHRTMATLFACGLRVTHASS